VSGTGRYIAVFKDDTSHERLLEIVELLKTSEGCVVHLHMEVALKAIVLNLSDDALQMVLKFPETAYVEEEGISYAANSGDGEGEDRGLWYQHRIDQLPGDGRGVDVYILDSGIRFQHREFGRRAKYGGYDAVDQYEYLQGTKGYVPLRGKDCHGHGTAVASLVGGITFGKATEANLFSVRVLRCDTTAPWSIVLDGLDYIAEIIPKRGQNAVVVLALSGSNLNSMNEAINNLNGLGVLVVAAAGNDGTDACQTSPASSPNVITVGSTDRQDNIASFSNYGPCVDLFAPGEDILAANNECDSCTGTMSGTTLSAALTAGLVAAYTSQIHFTPALMKERILYQCLLNAINFTSLPPNAQEQTPNRLLKRGCGGEIIVYLDEQGVLNSPEFPEDYLSNLRCKWKLVAERDCDYIEIDFTHITLEEYYDTLTVCLKDSCREDEKIVLTGDYGLPDCLLQSEGQNMTIEMFTDGSKQAPGFRATHIAIDGARKSLNKCTPVSDSSILLEAFSAANSVGGRFWMQKSWNEFFAGRKYGINVAVIDEVNGSVIATENFNQAKGQSNTLGIFIEKLPAGRIVCVAISDNGIYQLNDYAKRQLRWLGSSRINYLTRSDSWALIGVKGSHVPHQQAIEMSGTFSAQVSARVHLKSSYQQFFEITAESAGLRSDNYATITLNGTVVDIPYVGHDRGMHVMVVNEVTGMIVHRQVFDTSAESGAFSSSHQFVELIQALPEGRLVAIAIKEEAMAHMSDAAKQACESIGSALIQQVQPGNSWAIVGRKGARNGSVPEAMKYSEISRAKYVPVKTDEEGILCPILLQSSENNGVGSSIIVNETRISHVSSTTSGNLAVLVKLDECAVEKNISFISSNDLFNFIKPIPPGRTVVVNWAYGHGLNEHGTAALEAIGSARIRGLAYGKAWAIIGKKGVSIGTIVEDSSYTHHKGKALGTAVKIGRLPGSVTVQSAGSSTGDYGNIIVNGSTIFTMSPLYECGLNVVVFEGDTMKIRSVHTFNMTASNTSQDIEEFVKLTTRLPNDTVVALASNNAGDLNKTEEVRVAIEDLGSKYINQTTEGGCWALLGRKGASRGEVSEAVSNHGPVEIVSHAMPTPSKDCSIFIETTGTGEGGGLKVNISGHYNESLTSSQGVTIAIVKEESCELESIATYSTWYHKQNRALLLSLISKLPMGRTVLASIYASSGYPRYSYFESFKIAMELIGSSQFRRALYRDTWAIIGRKGAPMGSVPESLITYTGGVSHPVVSLSGNIKLEKDKLTFCENKLYPLHCLE
jgi:hypothetical protein